MKFLNIKNVALALAAIAVVAPVAQAQTHRYNPSIHLNGSANRGYTVYNGMTNGAPSVIGYTPSVDGTTPYLYGAPGLFLPQGALVVGSDGQIFDTVIANSIPIPVSPQNGVANSSPLPFSDKIEALRLPDNRLRIQWGGDTRPVASLKFSLLNRKRTVLQTTVVTDLPAEAVFVPTNDAAYYRVMITYSDGAVRSLVAKL